MSNNDFEQDIPTVTERETLTVKEAFRRLAERQEEQAREYLPLGYEKNLDEQNGPR